MGKSAARVARQQQALALRIEGKHYREIGVRLGVSHVQAFRDVSEVLGEMARVTGEKAVQLRELELRRCDQLTETFLPKAREGHEGAARTILQVMERRARLLGLDQKQTLAIEGHDYGPVTIVHRHIVGNDMREVMAVRPSDPPCLPPQAEPSR